MHVNDSKSGKVKIRRLREDELRSLVRVWIDSGLPYRPTGRDSMARLRKQLRANPDLFLGAFVGAEMVGAALVTDDGRKGWINRLAVLPGSRREGIAQRLIQSSEKILRRKGIFLFCANIERDNEVSMKLFEKAGYHFEDDILYFAKRERKDY